jgi:predicted dehydrogenase
MGQKTRASQGFWPLGRTCLGGYFCKRRMTMKKLKVAVIGAGNIARSAHLPVYAKRDDVEVAAIVDWNLDRAKECAEKFGVEKVFSTAEEAFALEDLDMADICVWNKSHAPVAIAAAKRGLHILCEKPLAWDLADAYAMKEAVDKSGKIFMTGMMNRYRNDVQLLRQMVDDGKFGEIYYAKATYVRRRGTPLGWFTDTQKSGGGPVIDIGVHCIDRTWYLMGCPKPVRISASTSYRIGDYQTKGVSRWIALDSDVTAFDTEDSACGVIHFENGASMMFEVAWAINLPPEETTYIAGSKAGAILEPLTIFSEDSGYLTDNTPTFEKNNSFADEIAHFIECVRENKRPISPIEDGIEVEKMLMGIYQSAREGKEILL